MDFAEFSHLVRDALAKLHDHVALESHPLAAFLIRSPDPIFRRGEHLQQLLMDALEELRPTGKATGTTAPEPASAPVEWRPYLVLHSRYVEGLSLPELQAKLALSERQLRREHSRALHALALRLWEHSGLPDQARPAVTDIEDTSSASAEAVYPLMPASLALDDLLAGVAATFRPYAQAEGIDLQLEVADPSPVAVGDRVLLRSILLSLLRLAAGCEPDGPVVLRAGVQSDYVELTIEFCPRRSFMEGESAPNLSESSAWSAVQRWAEQLGATLSTSWSYSSPRKPIWRWNLNLPRVASPVLLVVDDQPSAVNLFRRYLSRTVFRVVGITDPQEVLSSAQRLRPAAIILDVMMPAVDGWELLQALQAAPATRDIPVIMCSVWDEPELASALGAALFVKKPITQRDLLTALARLGLVEHPAGSLPADPSGSEPALRA